MQYPFVIKGEVSVHGGELALYPPPKIVEAAEPMLAHESEILDLGAKNGNTGFFLSERGHRVLSVEADGDLVSDGKRIAAALGGFAVKNRFLKSDIKSFEPAGEFDAVITLNALHCVDRDSLCGVLQKIRGSTKDGGLNILSAKICPQGEKEIFPEQAFFEPHELIDIYKNDGWEILFCEEDYKPICLDENNSFMASSRCDLIARNQHLPKGPGGSVIYAAG